MSEPAHKLPEEDKPDIRPDLHLQALEGGEDTTPRKKGHSSVVGDNKKAEAPEREALGDSPGHRFNPEGDEDPSPQKAESATKTATAAAATGGVAAGLAQMGKFFWGSRKRKATTLGIGGATTVAGGAFVALLIFLAPLKIVSMVQNLQNHFFGASEQAAGDMTEYLMKRYIVKKVMPGMVDQKCNSTRITKSCAVTSDASTPVGQLFNAWKDARLENKLADRYGFEIIRTGNNNFYIRTDRLQERIFLGEYTPGDTSDFDNKVFTRMSRSDIRAEMKIAFERETLWKQVMHKYRVGTLLERKYGIRRCVIACDFRDGIHDKIDAKKVAFKSYLFERVVAPRSELYALALNCALSSFDCAGGDQIESDGSHTNEFDRDVRTKLLEFRATYGSEALDDLYESSRGMREKGITGFFIEKMAGELAGRIASKAVPIIGWIDTGSTLIAAIDKFKPAVTAINYRLTAATAVSTYMVFRTPGDEIKTGKVDATVIGSFANSLDASDQTDQGGLAAEQTRYYQSINGTSTPQSNIASMLTPNVNAAGESGERCNDESALPAGQLLCPEMVLGLNGILNGAAVATNFIQNAPMFKSLGIAASIWNSTAQKILNLFGEAAMAVIQLTPFGSLVDKATEVGNQVMTSAIQQVFPSQLGDNPSGGRTYQVAALGANIAANDFAHYRLGGQKLTDQQIAEVRTRQKSETEQAFASKTLFARMFDTNDTSSLVSKIALSTPTSTSTAASTTVSTTFTNPFKSLLSGFSSLLPVPSSLAADGLDPSGVTQYGIPQEVIEAMGDPEAYWRDNCEDMEAVNKAWGEQAVQNPDTGQYENDTANLCQTLETAISSAGGKYDTDLLVDEDTQSPAPVSSGSGSAFRISTYNIETIKQSQGETEQSVRPRVQKDINNIKQKKFDVVGMQELEERVLYNMVKDYLSPDYEIYPANDSGYQINGPHARAIAYKKDKFRLIKSDSVTFQRMGKRPQPAHAPIVWLQDISGGSETGQVIIVMNTHNPAFGPGGSPLDPTYNGEIQRYEAGLAYAEKIKALQGEGLPIFFTGDFNEGHGIRHEGNSTYQRKPDNLNYCQLRAIGIVDVQDTHNNAKGFCGNSNAQGGNIDHIYMTEGMQINGFYEIPNAQTGSDHAAYYADIVVPGSGEAPSPGETTGWVWPAKNIRAGPCWNANYYGYGYHAGMDMNSNVANNPALAAHNGTVSRVGTDGAAGNYVTVRVSSRLFYSYEHLAAGSISVTAGDDVRAGQQIGIIGTTGAAPSNLGHLHMVVSVDGGLGSYSSTSQTNSNTRNPMNYLPKPAPDGYACTNS